MSDSNHDRQSGKTSIGNRNVRLLVIDHTGSLPHVQRRWDRLAAEPDIDLTLLSPRSWRENYRTYRYDPLPERRFTSVTGRTCLTGMELKSFYLTGLQEAFRRSRPDVVFMMEESFSVFGLQIERAVRRYAPDAPLIFYNNNVVSYDLPGFRLSRLYRWIARRVTPRCDLGLCVNRRAVEVLQKAGHEIPGLELFYGVDDEAFRPDHDGSDRASLLEKFGLAPETKVLLCLGRQLEGKGYQDVIEAVSRIQKGSGRVPLHLLIVGSGPYEKQISSLASSKLDKGSYTLLPTLPFDEIPTLMRGVDAHILPSHAELNEQFGRVNVEAMLSGVLAVASRSGGVADVIGEGGILFEPRDIDALTTIMERIIYHPGSLIEIRRAGREQALSKYSISRFVQGTALVVRRLAEGEEPRSIASSIPGEARC